MKKVMTALRLPALCLAALLALSGCGATATSETTSQADSAAVSSNAATQSTAATPEATGETRTISTVMGDVEIPANPQRIVGIQCFPVLKSLGAENAVDMTEREKLTYFAEDYKWEELMALDPDLIITSYYPGVEEYLERSGQIAPTITFDNSATTEEKQLFIGEVIGKQEVAQAQIKAYKETLAKSVQQLKDAGIYGSTVAILQYTSSGVMYAYGDKLGRGGDILYPLMGFKPTDIVQEKIIDGEEYYLELSMEALTDYADADYIIIMTPDEAINTLYENGVWKSLKPVQEGKFFAITQDEYMALFNMPSVTETQSAIEMYTERLLEVTK